MADVDTDIEGRTDETVIHLSGEIDASDASRLREEVFDLIETGQVAIALDLRDVTFIDSSGLAVMLVAAKWARRAGGDVRLRAPTLTLLRLLEICGLRTAMTITD